VGEEAGCGEMGLLDGAGETGGIVVGAGEDATGLFEGDSKGIAGEEERLGDEMGVIGGNAICCGAGGGTAKGSSGIESIVARLLSLLSVF